MKKLIFSTFLMAVSVTALTPPLPALAQSFDPKEVDRGEYLAIASDCAACHTAPGGKPLAGGLPIAAPMGNMYSSNITPAKQHGIGNYSLEDFSNALRKGVRRDGTHLYPAMPYTSYSLMTDEDTSALYAYFMTKVQPVDDPPAHKTDLPFPYNMRFALSIWNALFLNDKIFSPDASQTPEWNRGKYLVEGAAHCSVCHSPRGFLMQEKQHERMAGDVLGAWYAPNITSDPIYGIGAMTVEQVAQYLKTGKVHGMAQAAGDMALANQLSFSKLSDDDLKAMAVYVKSIPAVSRGSDKTSKFAFGEPGSDVEKFRGVDGVQSDNVYPGDGAQLFTGNCATCHGAEGQGTNDGYFPSLFHNSALITGGGRNLVAAILLGVSRTNAQGQAFMPGFGGKATDIANLSNVQIAAIANYVEQQYGDPKLNITTDLVEEVRQGKGPTPPLMIAVDLAKWVLPPFLLIVAYWLYARNKRKKAAPQSSKKSK